MCSTPQSEHQFADPLSRSQLHLLNSPPDEAGENERRETGAAVAVAVAVAAAAAVAFAVAGNAAAAAAAD